MNASFPSDPNRSESPAEESSTPTARQRRARSVLVVVLIILVAVIAWQWYRQRPAQRFSRAVAALQRDDLNGVRAELNGWPTDPAHESHRHYLQGMLLLRDRELAEALEEFGLATPEPTLRVRALTEAGGILYQFGRQGEAIGLLEQAITLDPQAVDAQRWLASSYYDIGVIPKALEHLTRVTELAPTDPRPHRLIGIMHKDFEHYSEAIEAFQTSLRLSAPQADNQELMLDLAECQVKQRQYSDAMHTLGLCAEGARRAVLQADCLLALGKPVDARQRVDTALAAAPDELDALLLSAAIHLEANQPEQAAAPLEHAIAKHPRDYIAHYRLSQVYRRLGKTDQAAQVGKIAEEIKALRDQFTALHEQASQQPDNPNVRLALAQTAMALGRPDLAEMWLRMALALAPDNAPARQALEQLRSQAPPAKP